MNFGIKRLIGKLTLRRMMADHEARRMRLLAAKRHQPDEVDAPPPLTHGGLTMYGSLERPYHDTPEQQALCDLRRVRAQLLAHRPTTTPSKENDMQDEPDVTALIFRDSHFKTGKTPQDVANETGLPVISRENGETMVVAPDYTAREGDNLAKLISEM